MMTVANNDDVFDPGMCVWSVSVYVYSYIAI